MVAEIISIGDELLIGQVVNTNASWIARQLHENGISVGAINSIPDDADRIKEALADSLERADVIILTGGLGPTKDDITKMTLCEFFGTGLEWHQPTLDNIIELFGSKGIPVLEKNRDQAMIPQGSTPLRNPFGTAPGLWFEKDEKVVVSLPGVPYEMKAILTGSVLPRLMEKNLGTLYFHRTVLTHGMGESMLAEKIDGWAGNLPANIKLAYLPQPGIVRLRLTASGQVMEELERVVDTEITRLRQLIPSLVFGEGTQTMEEVVGELLREQGKSLATAESCTGGYIAHLITSVPGSSDYYKGSVVAYDNEIKHSMLSVRQGSLDKFGAVSEKVVKEMAEGARNKFKTDFALATSGVAGPAGGTKQKPVGMIWIALASHGNTSALSFTFGDHRGRNIRRSSLAALNMLRMVLLEG
jgi:nicotinamide-nucleotide amidase